MRDDGPGISAEDLEHVFEPFFRGDYFGRDRRQGPGLGLPISSQLAELMGGSLQIANGDAGGAVARLILPSEYHESSDERD